MRARSRRPSGSGSAGGPRRRAAATCGRARPWSRHRPRRSRRAPRCGFRRSRGRGSTPLPARCRRSGSGRAPRRRRGSCARPPGHRARAGTARSRASCSRPAHPQAPGHPRTHTGEPSSGRSGSETPRDHRLGLRRKCVALVTTSCRPGHGTPTVDGAVAGRACRRRCCFVRPQRVSLALRDTGVTPSPPPQVA